MAATWRHAPGDMRPAPLRVMIVEDDPHVRQVLRRILAGLASEIVECGNGLEAPGLFASTTPDVVLMDIRLPGIDGLAAARRIRADCPSAVIVIVTNHDEASLRKAALDAGARGYVLKERLVDLRAMLGDWFGRPRA